MDPIDKDALTKQAEAEASRLSSRISELESMFGMTTDRLNTLVDRLAEMNIEGTPCLTDGAVYHIATDDSQDGHTKITISVSNLPTIGDKKARIKLEKQLYQALESVLAGLYS